MEELMQKWEDWYGDVLTEYQWCELEYKGRKVLYVHGKAEISCGGGLLSSDLIQVMGYADSGLAIDEEEQKEITELFKSRQGIADICFWSD